MKRLLLSLLLLFSPFLVHGQTCPASQATGVNVGLCSPATADHLLINPSSPALQAGGTVQLTATYILSDGNSGDDASASCDSAWASDNSAAATVGTMGLATAVGVGTAHISCTIPTSHCSGNLPCTGSATLTVQAPPIFNNPNPTTCANPCLLPQGLGPPSAVAYSFTFSATGSSHTPYTYSVSVGAIPAWASLNGSTGALTGTPNAVATTNFTIQVCDTIPACNVLPVSLAVVANSSSGNGPPAFGGSTTSTLTSNLFAGTNSTIPAAMQGTAMTTYSVTGNVFTANVTNSFVNGSIIEVSGCTAATFMNGMIITANGSTTSSAIVGPWVNKQHTAQTHANVGSVADATCYFLGQGWNSFVVAPFPAAGTTNCTLGNGQCPAGTLTMLQADLNQCAFDDSIPSGALNTLNNNVMCMLTNPTTQSGNGTNGGVYHISRSGETNDQMISLDDTASGYFFAETANGAINICHGHINATALAGKPGFLTDTPLISNCPHITSGNYGGFSQNTRPGVNSARYYYVDTSNQFDPKLKWVNPSYSAGSVTLGTATVIADLPTICPAWKYTSVAGLQSGTGGITSTTQFGIGGNDQDFFFGLGAGTQGNAGFHMIFHVHWTGGTATCENWDTEGFSGSGLYAAFIANQGSGYKVGDILNFQAAGVCIGSAPVTQIGAGGQVQKIGALTMTTNSGCVQGAVFATTGGSGTLALLQAGSIGTPATTCCQTIWPSGSTSPTATTIYVYGDHSGNISRAGLFGYTSGWGQTSQSTCSVCDQIYWQLNTTTLLEQTDNRFGGHPALGWTHRGSAAAPNYAYGTWNDPSCSTPSDCVVLTSAMPSLSQSHSTLVTPLGDDSYPINITSGIETPGKGQTTNPANWPDAFELSEWGVSSANLSTRWFMHFYTNTNNKVEFDALYGIHIVSPDGKFLLVPIDCYAAFAGNTGCGLDNTGKPFTVLLSVMLN